MKHLLSFVLLMATTLSYAQDLQLNDREYFERQGVNVLVFSNSFNGGFNDEKNSGIEIIHHGVLPVPSRCSMAITVLTSRLFLAMWLRDFSSAIRITSRTTMIGRSSGDRMREQSQEIQVMSSSVPHSRTL